jgi:hypothetical protein
MEDVAIIVVSWFSRSQGRIRGKQRLPGHGNERALLDGFFLGFRRFFRPD